MMRKVLLLLLVVSFLSACGEYDDQEGHRNTINVTTNKEFVLSDGIYLKVREVVDTRKPANSKSEWRGEARLRIQLYTGKRSVDTAVSTVFPNEILLDGVRIKLNSVYPYPEYDKTRKQSDYVVQLSLSKE
jgi:hypothetical protein